MVKYRHGIEYFDCNATNCPGWKETRTVHGPCCSFNYHPLAKENARIFNQAGKLSGMNILFSGNDLPSSLTVIFSQPGAFITLYSEVYALITKFDNYFRIYLTNDVVTKRFEGLPVKYRKCVLPSDMRDMAPSLVFRSRCILTCVMELINQECECHPYYMPIAFQTQSIRNCTIKDLTCIRKKAKGKISFDLFYLFISLSLSIFNIVIWDSPCSHCIISCNEMKLRIGNSVSVLEYKASKGALSI